MIDDLIYHIYKNSRNRYLNDVSLHGPAFKDKSAIDYVPLHGSIINEQSQLVFNTLDIATTFQMDRDRWSYLIHRIQEHPILFWGYSLQDAGVLQSLASIKGESRTKWIMLKEVDDANKKFFEALGFTIIQGDTSELLDYLTTVKPLTQPQSESLSKSSRNTRELFPDESIPTIGSVPVRSITQFYLGNAPVWYDIFSGNLYKTSHYYVVLDSINSGKHTIVTGIPGCGKTTLMMQLAADVKYNGHKLVLSFINFDKAKFILQKLNNQKAIIFVDNIADDIDAIDSLFNAPNVLVVGFERDYSYEIISHKIDRDQCRVINITELIDKDIQEIFSRIPDKIRSSNYIRPHTEAGAVPSLLEVIETNTQTPSIKERFKLVLEELDKESTEMHDLFVMICYVHSCRTPVSFDMAYAFLNTQDYSKVYEIISNLGKLVTEYTDNLIDQDQDLFLPRSTIVSEVVIDQTRSSALRRVLNRFHQEVSPFRIVRYDVFKKNAYDSGLARKAFINWRQGKEFYEYVANRDDSPYIYQQGALYLASQKRFSDAFAWIDKAIVKCNNRIFSIRNSYALILFRANIDRHDDDFNVRQTLDESMQILVRCYSDDKRKLYHALAFADQALKYFKKFGDKTSLEYLEIAKKWLIDEKSKILWHRNLNYLLRQVERVLVDQEAKE